MCQQITSDNITPRQTVRIIERHPHLTPIERAKGLALALVRLVLEEPEVCSGLPKTIAIKIMWEHSQMMANVLGYSIPNFDERFVVAVNENPSSFANVR